MNKIENKPFYRLYCNRVVYKLLSSRSFVKSRRLWVWRTYTIGFSLSFLGGSGGKLARKIFENWNAGKRISWHFEPCNLDIRGMN